MCTSNILVSDTPYMSRPTVNKITALGYKYILRAYKLSMYHWTCSCRRQFWVSGKWAGTSHTRTLVKFSRFSPFFLSFLHSFYFSCFSLVTCSFASRRLSFSLCLLLSCTRINMLNFMQKWIQIFILISFFLFLLLTQTPMDGCLINVA